MCTLKGLKQLINYISCISVSFYYQEPEGYPCTQTANKTAWPHLHQIYMYMCHIVLGGGVQFQEESMEE